MKEKSVLILRDDLLIETVARLHSRISDRFPDSGLSRLCGQLLEVAQQAAQRTAWIGRPIRWIRTVSYALALVLVLVLVGTVVYAIQSLEGEQVGVIELIQALESGLNDIIFFAIAIFFLFSLETRIKRQRAIAAVHELRSIAHIIDMHQLTKDPERNLRGWSDAKHSPKRTLTPFELSRYLDYCSEMLSLTGKIAALYVEQFDDPAAVAAVSEVEELSTGLSRKIWQKIIVTRTISDPGRDNATRIFGSGQRPDLQDGPAANETSANETVTDDQEPSHTDRGHQS